MNRLNEITEQIKVIKEARDILKQYYSETEFHKRKETHPHEVVPPSPHDEDIYKLLTAIQQLDFFVKKLQDEQFILLKKEDRE